MKDPLQDRKILVIDDNTDLLDLLDAVLSREGARVTTAAGAAEGLRLFYTLCPDLVLLDLMMPGMSGWEVCDYLRQTSDVPIIMLTALADARHVTRGLDSGADDYITKPFARSVLLARIRAALRRAEPFSIPAPATAYDDGYLAIDLDRRQVLVGQAPVHLTPTEYNLLVHLVQHADRVLTYRQILKDLWGPECVDAIQYIHVYLHRLRLKLEPDPTRPRYLLTEPGIGCRFTHRPNVRPRTAAGEAQPAPAFRQ